MSFDDTDYDDGVRPGRRKRRSAVETESEKPPAPPSLENCPVKPLGKRYGTMLYAFMSASADIHELKPNQLSSPAFLSALFEGRTKWLRESFPNTEKAGAYVAQSAGSWLIQRCVEKGYYDPDVDIRGPGAWRLKDGRLLLHLGDTIEIRSEHGSPEKHQPGIDIGGHVYGAAPPEPVPADTSAASEDVHDLFEFLHRWNYDHAEDPRVLLGWIGCCYLAGALRWRPHVWVSGDSSTGKSTLELLVRGLLGSAALSVSDATKAYIAARLKSAARPVLLDEAERESDPSRQKAVVELATLASKEGQGGLGRGSPDGTTREHLIRACFYFSSIVRAPLRQQEKSRIHVIDLRPLSATTVDDVRALNAGLARFGSSFAARLRARAVSGYWRFLANEKVLEEAIQSAWRRSGRVADQMGTLIAMAHVMLSDDVITPAQALAVLANFEAVKDEIVGRADDTEAIQCATHLLSTSITYDEDRGRKTRMISELVDDVRRLQGQDGTVFQGSLHTELRRRGLSLICAAGEMEQKLVVGNNHRGLHQLFEGTRWNGGAWAHVLRRLPGASATKYAVRFAGFQERGTVIPLTSLPLVTPEHEVRDSGVSQGERHGEAFDPKSESGGVTP